MVRLTVLGKSNAWPDADGACSGYLLEEGEFQLLLDCGTGVLAKLRRHIQYELLGAIVISHLHADHLLDLVPYSYALTNSTRGPHPRLRVWGPPGAIDLLARLAQALGCGEEFDEAFEIGEYEPRGRLALGPFSVRFCEVPHFVQAFALDLTSVDGRRLTYGADCRANSALHEFAHETDLLILEATLGGQAPWPSDGHMSAAQAGALAREAGARELLVTHFSDELDAAEIERCARDGFGARVRIARDGLSLAV